MILYMTCCRYVLCTQSDIISSVYSYTEVCTLPVCTVVQRFVHYQCLHLYTDLYTASVYICTEACTMFVYGCTQTCTLYTANVYSCTEAGAAYRNWYKLVDRDRLHHNQNQCKVFEGL